MSEEFLINDSLKLKITIHGTPEPVQFIGTFTSLDEAELIEESDESKKKDSDIPTSK